MSARMKTLGLVASVSLVAGCAHTAPQVVAEAPPPPPPPPPQVTAVPVSPPAVDPSAELAAALRGSIVFFDFDRDELKPEGMQALQRVAQVLRRHPGFAVRVEGNCDERGTEEYNLMLGERRATAARKYLVALGVDPSQLDTISFGALRPANPAHTEDAWAQNRRDELHPEPHQGG